MYKILNSVLSSEESSRLAVAVIVNLVILLLVLSLLALFGDYVVETRSHKPQAGFKL